MCRLLDKLKDKIESHQSTLKKSLNRIETLLNQPISTQTLDQDQETHQLSQVEMEDTQPTYEKNFKTNTQVLDNQLNRQASEIVSGQKKIFFSTQLAPRRKMSILDHICLDEVKKFNNVEKPIEKVCIFDDYPRFLDKMTRDHLATHRSRREQDESYCEDDCNDDEPIEEVKHVHEVCKFDDDSLCLDDLFRDDLVTYTPLEDKIESYYEDVCIVDEALFLDELFKDECDHSDEKTYIEDFKSRVSFEKRKLDLSIFTFDESTNDQALKNMIQEPLIDQSFENFFEDKLMCLGESNRDVLISYTPPKEIIDLNFEMMFEDELKFLDIHVVDTPIEMCDDDQILKSRSGKKKSRRRLRKVKNKLERMKAKKIKRLTSPISPMKRTH